MARPSIDPNTTRRSFAAMSHSPFTADFDNLAKEVMEYWRVPGLAIGVIDGDETYSKGYGFATLPDVPATADTLWYVGSTTKAFTAAALARMIASNEHITLRDGWSTTISSIIRDDFVLQDAWATAHLTLDDAVCHRTGMVGYRHAWQATREGRSITIKEFVRNMRYLSPEAEPRTKWIYSNALYVTLAHVIETVAGESLESVMKDLIWDPLHMETTYLNLRDALDGPEHLASGYYWDETAKSYNEVPTIDVEPINGAGGILSNVADFTKWIRCLIQMSKPFSDTEHEDMRKPRMMMMSTPNSDLYGLGWIQKQYKGHQVYTHDGGTHAYGASVWWLPGVKYGVVAFGNTAGSSNDAESELVRRLIDAKLGVSGADSDDFSSTRLNRESDNAMNQVNRAVDILFPDRPSPTLPPTINATELQGTYRSQGYGTVTFEIEAHPTHPDQKILAAYRPEMVWRYYMKLHHVSGDYWIMYLGGMENPTLFREYQACQFKIGIDSKAVGFEVDWKDTIRGISEGTVWFEKLS
ncbi:hypothetical protein QQS21_010000 [Conoideocrella luteorostrata]|uniref:Beta-lactamase-related domain-containing protein n=1 Tax=Conoideocrella luteorostrata TaxID=1105319 RepID=A0AAJ0CFW3_9HYPO|nr:hypothetical protein QQS21_010000 [Conoideocrella luteorostrata]